VSWRGAQGAKGADEFVGADLEILLVAEEHRCFPPLLPWLEDFVLRRLVCVQWIFFFFPFFSCIVV
jgi:hypothetical protein